MVSTNFSTSKAPQPPPNDKKRRLRDRMQSYLNAPPEDLPSALQLPQQDEQQPSPAQAAEAPEPQGPLT